MILMVTMIHDNLLCMDDGNLWQGKPVNHKVFEEAMALLAGNTLLCLAYKHLSHYKPPYAFSVPIISVFLCVSVYMRLSYAVQGVASEEGCGLVEPLVVDGVSLSDVSIVHAGQIAVDQCRFEEKIISKGERFSWSACFDFCSLARVMAEGKRTAARMAIGGKACGLAVVMGSGKVE